jgi:hypothetical protein
MVLGILSAITGGLHTVNLISNAITGIGRVISDAKVAAINATTEQERIKANERIAALQAERDKLIAELNAQAQVLTATVGEVNETMRLELLPENRHWFYTGWRPAAGWIFDVNAVVFGLVLAAATLMAFTGAVAPLREIAAAWPIYAAYFTMLLLVVGVAVVARSADKRAGVATSAIIKK